MFNDGKQCSLSWHLFILGHHPYVNIRGKDPDLTYENEIYRYAKWHPLTFMHKYQWLTFIIIWVWYEILLISMGVFLIIIILNLFQVFGVNSQAYVADAICLETGFYQKTVPAMKMSVCVKHTHAHARTHSCTRTQSLICKYVPRMQAAVFFVAHPRKCGSVLFLRLCFFIYDSSSVESYCITSGASLPSLCRIFGRSPSIPHGRYGRSAVAANTCVIFVRLRWLCFCIYH